MDADMINEANDILIGIYKFSSEMVNLGTPISDSRLEVFEEKIGHLLPDDFKYMLKKHNGFSLSGIEVFGFDEGLKGSSLDQVYQYEHFEVTNKMPLEFLPFSPDGRGNHYCLDLSRTDAGSCPVVFWQWDFQYQTSNDIEICNENFYDWIREVMISWTLEEYNYDGTPK